MESKSPDTTSEKPAETHEIKEEKKDDEEISIDFSKIKNIFKKKESDAKDKIALKEDINKGQKEEDKDDEINFDLSKLKKIKNIFKKDTNESADEDLSIDFKKFSNFFVKHRVLLFLIIPIFLSIFLRVQPAYLPITDEWATNSVIDNLRSQIRGQINQQYPNLPEQNRNTLVETELQKVLREQKSQISQQITATSNFFKSKLQDDTGQTYLLAIDPYFWMRHAKNILENGHAGDEIKNGVPWNNHMVAPRGRAVIYDMFHANFEAFLFKFFSFFNKNINLMAVVFYVPVLISALAVIPTFFITRKLVGNIGGIIAAIVVAIHPSFLTRTVGGFADTDAYNVMFPLFIAWLFLEALDSKNTKNTIILSSIGGLLIGFYSFTWGGWWYIFDFILMSTFLYLAYYSFVHKKELLRGINFLKQTAVKNSLIFILTFFIMSALFVSLFSNLDVFQQFYNNPAGFAKLKEVGITTIWPNVFTTVAEQNPASLNNVINQVGLGKFYFFLIALMGITLTLTKKAHKKLWFVAGTLAWYIIIFLLKVQNLNTFLVLISIPIIIRIIIALWESDTEIDIKYSIFLILWFIATVYASTKGIRFTLLLVPAFAIGFGIALGELYRHASVWLSKGLHVNKLISKVTVIVVIGLLLVPTYSSAKRTAEQEIPSFNDAWKISLDKIKADSKPDAIINSWWDFGHWFKFWADRAVTFDGTTQNTPMAHWVGKALLTDNEELAIGLLRMLDCGSTDGFDAIANQIGDGAKAIDIMYEIMPLNREGAKKILTGLFNEESAEDILESTHCQPPENYFITSEDMIGKSGVWAHFGSWDFNRGLIYNTLKKKEYSEDMEKGVGFLQDRFGYSETDAENLFYEVQSITTSDQANSWIAPWPGYAGTVGCNKEENILQCSSFIINLTTNDAYAPSNQGNMHSKSLSIPTNEGIIFKEYNESIINLQNGRSLGIALIKNGDSYRMLQMDSDLTGSMFTRLFYQDGIGLRYFKKFSDESSVFGGRIIVWKVDWEGKEKNIIEVPEPEVEEEIVEEETTEESPTESTEENTTAESEETNTTE
jgi:dolichyl-diphosphooligosaccharide--protein glycosyltransferase